MFEKFVGITFLIIVSGYLLGAVLSLLAKLAHKLSDSKTFQKQSTNHCTEERFSEIARCPGRFGEEAEDRMDEIGQRIAKAAGLPEVGIVFHLLNQDKLQGYSLPPKWIGITKGFYMDCRTDDELASILAHEIGHLAYSRLSPRDFRRTYKEEYVADSLAVLYLRKAGYDPKAFARTQWRGMLYSFQAGDPQFCGDCSTHPSPLKRIILVNRTIRSLC